MNETNITLSELYTNALKSMKEAETKPRGDERQNAYLTAKKLFDECLNLIDRISLYSQNESVDDIATTDLKFLLVPAYLSKIMISLECGPKRLETFQRAKDYSLKFFQLIFAYGLGDERVRLCMEQKEQTLLSSKPSPSLQDAMRTRNEKIERYKQQRLLNETISELEHRIANEINVDDEVVREYYMKLIRRWIEDTLESFNNEISMGLMFETRASDITGGEHRKPQPPARNESRPIGNITIVKNELQKQVFGIGYPSRPTVTVDEFINQKIESGDLAFNSQKEIYSNSLQRYAEEPNLRRDQDEQDTIEREKKEEIEDANELERQRRWDEFKDDNPRGSGNRHNMG